MTKTYQTEEEIKTAWYILHFHSENDVELLDLDRNTICYPAPNSTEETLQLLAYVWERAHKEAKKQYQVQLEEEKEIWKKKLARSLGLKLAE